MLIGIGYSLIAMARKICFANDKSDSSFYNTVYALDSTTIDLCLNVFVGRRLEGQKTL